MTVASHQYDTGTSVPLIQASAFEYGESQNNNLSKFLPQLPSHKFRHTVWHELRSTQVKGDQLRAPRVREGPESKEETFYSAADDQGELIHHSKTGSERVTYRDHQENWEAAVHVNLSYQKLDHSYQLKNFIRILHRMKSVEELTLVDNSLRDLSGLSFPRCRVANFSKNYMTSFEDLPKMPLVRHLTVTLNQIKDLRGLNRFPQLESLEMFGNGITYSRTYRQQVFKKLPNLKILDRAVKTKADMQVPADIINPQEEGTCTIL